MTDLKWTPITIRLGQIRPWMENPRMSTKAQARRLIKSERELGQIQTLAVSPFDGDYVDLYDGHQRVSAWLTVKDPSFEVVALQSNRPLTDDERRKVSVLLHMATGSWDWRVLSSWSAADLREWGMDKDALENWNNDALNLRESMMAEQATEFIDFMGSENETKRETNNFSMLGKGKNVGFQFGDIMVTLSRELYDKVWLYVDKFDNRVDGVIDIFRKVLDENSDN